MKKKYKQEPFPEIPTWVLAKVGARVIMERAAEHCQTERPVIHSPEQAAMLVQDMAYLPKEEIRVLLLDTSNRLLDIKLICVGSLNVAAVPIADIFRAALKNERCAAIILAHNHPSGTRYPSPEDIELTRQVIQAGKLLGIHVLDHIIVTPDGFLSLKDHGYFEA